MSNNYEASTWKFPYKVHDLLSTCEHNSNLDRILSWQPHGRCFKIHDTKEFTNVILPAYSDNKKNSSKKTKFSSFLRNLNVWGFLRLSTGRDKGCYYHECFVRGYRTLCSNINRKPINGNKVRRKLASKDEPNFYESNRYLYCHFDGKNGENPETIELLPQVLCCYKVSMNSQMPGINPISPRPTNNCSSPEKQQVVQQNSTYCDMTERSDDSNSIRFEADSQSSAQRNQIHHMRGYFFDSLPGFQQTSTYPTTERRDDGNSGRFEVDSRHYSPAHNQAGMHGQYFTPNPRDFQETETNKPLEHVSTSTPPSANEPTTFKFDSHKSALDNQVEMHGHYFTPNPREFQEAEMNIPTTEDTSATDSLSMMDCFGPEEVTTLLNVLSKH